MRNSRIIFSCPLRVRYSVSASTNAGSYHSVAAAGSTFVSSSFALVLASVASFPSASRLFPPEPRSRRSPVATFWPNRGSSAPDQSKSGVMSPVRLARSSSKETGSFSDASPVVTDPRSQSSSPTRRSLQSKES